MPVQVGQVFNAALHQKLFGQEIINTMAIRVETVGTNTDEPSWLNAIFGDDTGVFNAVASLRALLTFTQTSEVEHTKWRVSRVIPSPSQPYDFPILTRNTGTLGGTCETANIAMCISRRGAQGGRSNVGRVAFAGQPALFRAAGKWTVFAVNVGGIAASAIVGRHDLGAAIGILSYGFYVGERKAKAGKPFKAAHYVECVTGTARDTVRVQRSRTVGVGS